MTRPNTYLMENQEEAVRLDIKTDPEAVQRQAIWCGVKPGLRVLDAGCGSGKTTSILHEMVQPGGEVLGVDYSEERIHYAKEHHGKRPGIDFQLRDIREPLDDLGQFDIIWVRFVLEYYCIGSFEIVKNLMASLKPDGYLCLLDLDYNCLSHYELPAKMGSILIKLMDNMQQKYNFDPYAGRKLYSYLYDLGYRNIQVHLMAHHLIYGEIRPEDNFNWTKKVEVTSIRAKNLFEKYPGGCDAFFADFKKFFHDPRRFTYTPLIMVKGMKPVSD
ncbi:MAG: class I SAM-dependent methyltransferase [Deltaproteobacteria bacterium]|nr:class I SAM-dependent methyltransferase [Deltaproteobacteria bacterium]